MKPIIRLKEQEGGAFLGEIEMPLAGGGRIIVGALALGDDPEELGWGFSSLKSAARKIGSRAKALKKVAAIAKRVSQDPVVKALMPAQVNAAVKATSAIAKMAEQRGSKYMKKIAPHLPAAQKAIAKALAKDGLPAQPREAPPAEAPAEAPAEVVEPIDIYGQQPAEAYDPAEAAEEGDQFMEAYGEYADSEGEE